MDWEMLRLCFIAGMCFIAGTFGRSALERRCAVHTENRILKGISIPPSTLFDTSACLQGWP